MKTFTRLCALWLCLLSTCITLATMFDIATAKSQQMVTAGSLLLMLTTFGMAAGWIGYKEGA